MSAKSMGATDGGAVVGQDPYPHIEWLVSSWEIAVRATVGHADTLPPLSLFWTRHGLVWGVPPHGRGLEPDDPKVPSNPNHPMSPWFYDKGWWFTVLLWSDSDSTSEIFLRKQFSKSSCISIKNFTFILRSLTKGILLKMSCSGLLMDWKYLHFQQLQDKSLPSLTSMPLPFPDKWVQNRAKAITAFKILLFACLPFFLLLLLERNVFQELYFFKASWNSLLKNNKTE